MKLRRAQGNPPAVVLDEIEPFFLDLLLGLPGCADPGDNRAAHARLFSAPMPSGGVGDEFNEDWERYVEPEIKELFQSARDIVVGDLATLPSPTSKPPEAGGAAPGGAALEIPRRHAEAWLSVLNQARLVLAARHGFGERDMEKGWPMPPFTPRQLDLFRVHFFEDLQQILLGELGYD